MKEYRRKTMQRNKLLKDYNQRRISRKLQGQNKKDKGSVNYLFSHKVTFFIQWVKFLKLITKTNYLLFS